MYDWLFHSGKTSAITLAWSHCDRKDRDELQMALLKGRAALSSWPASLLRIGQRTMKNYWNMTWLHPCIHLTWKLELEIDLCCILTIHSYLALTILSDPIPVDESQFDPLHGKGKAESDRQIQILFVPVLLGTQPIIWAVWSVPR